MTLSEYFKPALTVVGIAALCVGYYLFEHRSHPEEPETPPVQASVVVTKATNACFSDLVRATGFIVPRREAVVGVELGVARDRQRAAPIRRCICIYGAHHAEPDAARRSEPHLC